MAYFDNPNNAAMWEKEMALLRAEKRRRQARSGLITSGEDIGFIHDARGRLRKAEGFGNIRETTGFKFEQASGPLPLRESVTFEQLETEAVIREDSALTPTQEPVRERITFEQLKAEAGVEKALCVTSLQEPVRELITFEQLKTEAGALNTTGQTA